MRTRVLNHFHTFHPEAQAELNRLAAEEARLTLALARRSESEPAEPKPKRRMSEPPAPGDDIEAELEKVRAAMVEPRKVIASGVVRIVIKGLTRGEYRRLLVEHPPREDDPLDAQLGYNSDSFGDAFVQACILRTESLDGEPVPNEWSAWADEMTNGQWEEVLRACFKLTNDGEPVFPQ
jgi:hypothetical protein